MDKWEIRFEDGRVYKERMWLSFKKEKRQLLLLEGKGSFHYL